MEESKFKKKDYLKASLAEILTPFVIYLAYFVFIRLPWQAGLSVAVVLGIFNTVAYFFVHKKHRNFLYGVSVIFSLVIGMLIATVFSKFGVYSFPDNLIIAVTFTLFFIVKTPLLLFGSKKYRLAVGILFVIALFALTIVLSVYSSKSSLFIESAVMSAVAMSIMFGEVLYFYTEDNVMSKINVGYVSVYYIILAVVLAIVSEGDCLGDCCDDGLSGMCDGASNKKNNNNLPPLE